MNFTGNPISVQLYTLRKDCEKDFPGTLRKVASLGFGAVEFAGLYGHSAEEIRQVLNEAKLRATGCHVGLPDLQKNFDQIQTDYVTTLGCDYVIVPSGPRKFDDGGKTWRKFCEDMRAMTRQCREAGIKLGYHNHSFEFENTVDGKPAYDIMFHEDPANSPVAEMDICWVANGKHDPVNELRRLKNRVRLLHVKDLNPGPPGRDADVGTGVIQWNAVYKAAHEAGVKWLIVERDHPDASAFDSISNSLKYLKTSGLEYPPQPGGATPVIVAPETTATATAKIP